MASIDTSGSNIAHYARMRREAVDHFVENREVAQATIEANIRAHKEKVQTFMEPETAKLFNLYAPTYIDLYA